MGAQLRLPIVRLIEGSGGHCEASDIEANGTNVFTDASSGTVTFNNIVIDHYGRYFLQFRLRSSPSEFDVYAPSNAFIDVFPDGK